MRNADIVQAWSKSSVGYKGIMRTTHMSTDGGNLFSYGLRIGETINGAKVVYDYTANSGHFYSMTTSQHVGLAKQAIMDMTYFDKVITDWTDEKEKDNWNSVCCCHYS